MKCTILSEFTGRSIRFQVPDWEDIPSCDINFGELFHILERMVDTSTDFFDVTLGMALCMQAMAIRKPSGKVYF